MADSGAAAGAEVDGHAAFLRAARNWQSAAATLKEYLGENNKDMLKLFSIVEDRTEIYSLGVNAVGVNGATPLMDACSRGSTADVATLIAYGADPTAEGEIRRKSGGPSRKFKSAPVLLAAQDGHVEILQLLLACSVVDVNQASSRAGRTALLNGCAKGRAVWQQYYINIYIYIII